MQFEIIRATEADIPFVVGDGAGLDGYDAVVGRWDEARHRQALADGIHACSSSGLRNREADRICHPAHDLGIARTRQTPDPAARTVTQPGRARQAAAGVGRRQGFSRPTPTGFVIGHFPENLRARRAYEAIGFVVEGIARGSAYLGGVPKDEVIMSILRPEWEALSRTRQSG